MDKRNEKLIAAAKAERIYIDISADEIYIACPEGFRFQDEAWGMLYSTFPFGRDEYFTKVEAYKYALQTIRGGIEKIHEGAE